MEQSSVESIAAATQRALQGNLARGAKKLEQQNKLFVRERLALLLDSGSFVEDGLLANAAAEDLPADGVVTGIGKVAGRTVYVVANDPTVKAGSWGARTVEKMIRATEYVLEHEVPLLWLVDSAGARITDQVQMFPGRRGAGRIFYNQNRISGRVPQICCLFGPSAAGGAYIPSFCDVIIMVDQNASMYLGSPRMAEMVIGEKVSLEEMGGARMHTSVSGCGDNLAADDTDAIEQMQWVLSYLPSTFRVDPPVSEARQPLREFAADVIPTDERAGYDIHEVIDCLVDEGSFFAIKPDFAPELAVGFARLDGRPVGVVANNPENKGGVLFGDSADKAARFVTWCDAFNVQLLFLSDVPGFMIGSEVEREGIIRHGAKMVAAVSEATVPKLCVVLRKSYGAGLYAMCGPAFGNDGTIALPNAEIAVMGPEAAVNAVYANKIAAIEDLDERAAYVEAAKAEYSEDVDLLRLASELVVDVVVAHTDLRREILLRFDAARGKSRIFTERHHGVPPV